MGVISIRLNKEDENVLNSLKNYLEKDKSSIIKEALHEKYEELRDLMVIDEFEKNERDGNVSFVSADDILNEISKE